MKTNKSPGYNHISFNTINNVFDFIVESLRYIFRNSLAQGIFPKEMKIAEITPTYKGGDKENIVNYRPISFLLYFSKILEKIMYNRPYLYLTENNLLYSLAFKKDIPLIMLLFKSQIKYTESLLKKLKFSIKDFFCKCDQIRRKLRIWSHLLKKSLMDNFIFCAVLVAWILFPINCFSTTYTLFPYLITNVVVIKFNDDLNIRIFRYIRIWFLKSTEL